MDRALQPRLPNTLGRLYCALNWCSNCGHPRLRSSAASTLVLNRSVFVSKLLRRCGRSQLVTCVAGPAARRLLVVTISFLLYNSSFICTNKLTRSLENHYKHDIRTQSFLASEREESSGCVTLTIEWLYRFESDETLRLSFPDENVWASNLVRQARCHGRHV